MAIAGHPHGLLCVHGRRRAQGGPKGKARLPGQGRRDAARGAPVGAAPARHLCSSICLRVTGVQAGLSVPYRNRDMLDRDPVIAHQKFSDRIANQLRYGWLPLPNIRFGLGNNADRRGRARIGFGLCAELAVLSAYPCSMTGACGSRCSSRHTPGARGANAPHQRRSRDPNTLVGLIRSIARRAHFATATGLS